MPPVELLFAVHNHQPVGNFDHVIENAYQLAYRPFLEVLEAHPGVRIALHQSGILWEWLAAQHPEHLETVARLVSRGQIELLGGAYYEPLLPAIPEPDRQGQIALLSRFLSQRFGVTPRGAWVAERVWEPQLAATLARAGLEFTLVDDTHFEAAGVPAWELDGSFVTEEEGRVVRVFAICRRLRELLPFASPEETVRELAGWGAGADDTGTPLCVYADDGEKFGVWTGTHDLCYRDRWLDRFFSLLEANADWIRMRTFAECVDRSPPRRRVYLPAAAYAEMMEWALPPESQRQLRRARARLAGDEDGALGGSLRGGTWRGFLARYPESNWMHKRMLAASHAVEAQAASNGDPARLARARDAVWRAQCNCAYWHGLFGGLYSPHLRAAIYAQVIAAENALASPGDAALQVLDVDADGLPEVVLRTPALVAIVKPDEGGAVFELDARGACFNLLDMLARREEVYHEKVRAALQATPDAAGNGAPPLVYDAYRRGSCIDHWLAAPASLADFAAAALPELGRLAGCPYGWTVEGGGLRLERAVALRLPGDPLVRVTKRLQLDGSALVAHYTLRNEAVQAVTARFGIEMGINFLAGDAADRWFEVPGRALPDRRLRSTGSLPAVDRIDVVDAWRGLRTCFASAPAADLWWVPIETVSMAQHGVEHVYQGSALLFVHEVSLAAGAACELRLRQEVGAAE